ncbi:MAG: acyltransferase [Coriobacteriales bacterium]|nr:acyltransferase [Coriobacteriales bacterium]
MDNTKHYDYDSYSSNYRRETEAGSDSPYSAYERTSRQARSYEQQKAYSSYEQKSAAQRTEQNDYTYAWRTQQPQQVQDDYTYVRRTQQPQQTQDEYGYARRTSQMQPDQDDYAYVTYGQQEPQAEEDYSEPPSAYEQAVKKRAPRFGNRIDSIEGLRALAIVSVVLYHLGLTWFPSGHMGVVMFLVLTGYLVTCSLMREFERFDSISLKDFWIKRFKRIWPAMALVVLVVAVLCIIFNHVLLTKMRPDIAPSLLFFLNWSYIASGASYFDAIGGPSPLTHLWYVALDAQVCIVLPLIVLAGMRVAKLSRRHMSIVFLVLAVISAILMAVLFDPNADPSRVYYGTDTRLFSVALGACLACLWPLGSIPDFGEDILFLVQRHRSAQSQTDEGSHFGRDENAAEVELVPTLAANVAGVVALVVLLVIMFFVPANATFFYYGGMVFVSLLTIVLLCCLMMPGSWLAKVFSVLPMVWLGSRSFALYLWHYPIIQLLGAGNPTSAWWIQLLAVAISLGLAEVTFRFFEQPLAQGKLTEVIDSIKERGIDFADRSQLAALIPAGVGTLALLGAVIGCFAVPETTLVPKDAIVSTGVGADKAMDLAEKREERANQAQLAENTGEAVTQQTADGTEATATTEPPAEASQPVAAEATIPEGALIVHESEDNLNWGVLNPILIGDSVPGDAEEDFYSSFPDGLHDCYIGRRPEQGLEVLRGYLEQGGVGNIIIMACFNNTTPQPETMDAIVELLEGRQLFLVGTFHEDGFMEAANLNLQGCASIYDNVYYIDWPAVVSGRVDELLWDDHEHLKQPDGPAEYMNMIARAVAPAMIADGGWVEAI